MVLRVRRNHVEDGLFWSRIVIRQHMSHGLSGKVGVGIVWSQVIHVWTSRGSSLGTCAGFGMSWEQSLQRFVLQNVIGVGSEQTQKVVAVVRMAWV